MKNTKDRVSNNALNFKGLKGHKDNIAYTEGSNS